jgi:L-iditol 2-dehydrogenase
MEPLPAIQLRLPPEFINFLILIKPLACVVHAVLELTHITVGDVVLVTGSGAIGLLAMQVAKAHGATTIVAGIAKDVHRLEKAKKLGADQIVNVMQQNVIDEVNAITDSRGTDIVFECSGNERAANDALLAVKKRGQFTQIGLFGKPITLDFEKVCFKELKVTGSAASRRISWEKALQLAAQEKVQLKPLVSDVLPITEWKKVFKMFEEKKGLKLVLISVEN